MSMVLNDKFPLRTAETVLEDTSTPLLRIRWKDISVGVQPINYCSLAFDKNAINSKLGVFLNIGNSSTDYKQYQFAAHTTEVADPAGLATEVIYKQVTTLGALVAALNALQEQGLGIFAARLNAPANYSLDTDDFIDMTETGLGTLSQEVLFKDASAVKTTAIRIGVPYDANNKIGAGRLEIVRVTAFANSDSATDCIFKIYSDPNDEIDDRKELAYTRYVPDNAITELYDFTKDAPVEKGPILVEITATTSLAGGAWVRVAYRSAEK